MTASKIKAFVCKYKIDVAVIIIGFLLAAIEGILSQINCGMISFDCFLTILITGFIEFGILVFRDCIGKEMKDWLNGVGEYDSILSSAQFAVDMGDKVNHLVNGSDDESKRKESIERETEYYQRVLDYIERGFVPIRYAVDDNALYRTQREIIESTKDSLFATHYVTDKAALEKWGIGDVSSVEAAKDCIKISEYPFNKYFNYIITPHINLAKNVQCSDNRRLFVVPKAGYAGLQSTEEIWRRVLTCQHDLGFDVRFIYEDALASILVKQDAFNRGYHDDLLISDGKRGFFFRQESSWAMEAYETVSEQAAAKLTGIFVELWKASIPIDELNETYGFLRGIQIE